MTDRDRAFFRQLHIEPAEIQRPTPRDWTEHDQTVVTEPVDDLQAERNVSNRRAEVIADQVCQIEAMQHFMNTLKIAAAVGWGLALGFSIAEWVR